MAALEVIYENKDYIVVNKASGLISEKSLYENITVETQVLNHLSKQRRTPYVGVIHRLDRVTSGVLIFAKKKSILVAFNKLFSSRKIQKTYLTVVKNKPQKNKGTLVNFIFKNNKEKKAEIVPSKTKDSLNSTLSYKLIDENKFGYLLEIQPKTGRFHQIRVQLANIGLPIIGDEKYGSDQQYLPLSICLHAWKIRFKDVETNEQITYEAPLPESEIWKFKSV